MCGQTFIDLLQKTKKNYPNILTYIQVDSQSYLPELGGILGHSVLESL